MGQVVGLDRNGCLMGTGVGPDGGRVGPDGSIVGQMEAGVR